MSIDPILSVPGLWTALRDHPAPVVLVSPIVAGAMALAESYFPGETRQQTIDRVLAAVDDISAQNPGIATKMGSGRLNLTKLFYDPSASFKHYGVDGDIVPVTKDVDRDGIIEPADGDFVYIIFGMRRGGETYYAIDVTDKNSPDLIWTQDFVEGGESW